MAELTDEQKAERTLELLLRPTNANASNININAGGLGVQICAMLCVAMAVATGFMAWNQYDTKAEYRSRMDKQELKHEAELQEVKSDIKAIRAYINAGLVQQKGKN